MNSASIEHTGQFGMRITWTGPLSGLPRERRSWDGRSWDGKPLFFVDIHADDIWYACVTGDETACAVLRQLTPAIEAKRHVIVCFELGDLHPDAFTYLDGPKAGQSGVAMKSRLLCLVWATVDGKEVYRASMSPVGSEAPAGTVGTDTKRSAWPSWAAALSLLESRRSREMCRAPADTAGSTAGSGNAKRPAWPSWAAALFVLEGRRLREACRRPVQ